MENKTSIAIVKKLLANKESMEKTHDFVTNTIRKTQEMNPVAKLRVIQLHNEIENLKHTEGESRKAVAAKLVKSLGAPPKSTFCSKCGTKLTPGAPFCSKCGAKKGKISM